MKTTDLMVGDLITLKSNGVVTDAQVRVEEIVREGLFATDCDNLIGFDDIEPIPLTEENLKANGCTPPYEHNLYSRYSYFLTPDNKYCVQMSAEHCSIGITVKYVHQLQHALRLCGLNELADNFKLAMEE